MHFRLPVVAFDAGAVPATLGGAGVLVSEKRHADIGELLWRVATDTTLRDALISRGVVRVGAFTYERFSESVAGLVKDLQETNPTAQRMDARAV
jgi:glycosyltransferase involved in cell wall biosynthesis